MEERIIIPCKGLYIKKSNGRYREVTSLEFLLTKEEGVDEAGTLNPIIVEDVIPKSIPGDAIKILEQRLPLNLLDIRECFEKMFQENLKPFIYKGNTYIFIDNILNLVIAKKEK